MYPSGEFKINETRVVYLEKGTSLLSIATLYNIPLKYIYDFNDFLEEKDLLDKSQVIYLQRKRKVGSTDYHVVSQGETLYDIAQKEGIRLEALMQLNHLSARQTPAAGEKLFLQQQAPAIPALAQTDKPSIVAGDSNEQSEEGEYEVYVVQAKETLYAISKKYNVSVQQLVQWNNLTGNYIKEGMELIISQKDYEIYKNSQ
jgi:LysM repeat protein